jgi:hypothetical protein
MAMARIEVEKVIKRTKGEVKLSRPLDIMRQLLTHKTQELSKRRKVQPM